MTFTIMFNAHTRSVTKEVFSKTVLIRQQLVKVLLLRCDFRSKISKSDNKMFHSGTLP